MTEVDAPVGVMAGVVVIFAEKMQHALDAR